MHLVLLFVFQCNCTTVYFELPIDFNLPFGFLVFVSPLFNHTTYIYNFDFEFQMQTPNLACFVLLVLFICVALAGCILGHLQHICKIYEVCWDPPILLSLKSLKNQFNRLLSRCIVRSLFYLYNIFLVILLY